MSHSTKHLAFGLLLVVLGGCVPEPTPAEVEAKIQEAIRWYTGEAGHIDDAKAHALLIDAVDLDYPLPQMWIARCYSRGRMNFERDSTQARLMAAGLIDRVRRIAEEGSVEAAFLLGSAYDEGLGVPVDSVTAMAWFLKAGEQGHVLAQHNLGNAYFAGRGVVAQGCRERRRHRPVSPGHYVQRRPGRAAERFGRRRVVARRCGARRASRPNSVAMAGKAIILAIGEKLTV